MANVAPGILTNGLGGNASSMIIGQYHIGFFDVDFEIIEPKQPIGGGAGPVSEVDKTKTLIITVKHKTKTWKKVYTINTKREKIIIKISDIINTIINQISVKIANFRKLLTSVLLRKK